MHDARQQVLSALTAVKKGSCNDACGHCLVAMAAFRLEPKALLHNLLPFLTMRSWLCPCFERLPLHYKVRDFVWDRLFYKIVEVVFEKLSIESQLGVQVATKSSLSGTSPPQRIVNRDIGELDVVMIANASQRFLDSIVGNCYTAVCRFVLRHLLTDESKGFMGRLIIQMTMKGDKLW